MLLVCGSYLAGLKQPPCGDRLSSQSTGPPLCMQGQGPRTHVGRGHAKAPASRCWRQRPVAKAAQPEPEQSLPAVGAPERPLWGEASPSPSCGATAPETRTPSGWQSGPRAAALPAPTAPPAPRGRRAARLVCAGRASLETGRLQTGGPCGGKSAPEEGIPCNDHRTGTGDRGSRATAVWGA